MNASRYSQHAAQLHGEKKLNHKSIREHGWKVIESVPRQDVMRREIDDIHVMKLGFH
jgi:hypothetical protein